MNFPLVASFLANYAHQTPFKHELEVLTPMNLETIDLQEALFAVSKSKNLNPKFRSDFEHKVADFSGSSLV